MGGGEGGAPAGGYSLVEFFRLFSVLPYMRTSKKDPNRGPGPARHKVELSLPRAELELRHAGFKSWEGAPSRERPIDQDGAYGPEAGPTER
jgi:hypothetical protein